MDWWPARTQLVACQRGALRGAQKTLFDFPASKAGKGLFAPPYVCFHETLHGP
jgi:hypothetical protein